MAIDTSAYKAGKKVNVETAKGILAGKVLEVVPGARGAFIKVSHADGKTGSYRPAKVTLA